MDPYSDLNRRLYPEISCYRSWSEQVFSRLIAAIDALPEVATEQDLQVLERSRLVVSVSNLANTIGRSAPPKPRSTAAQMRRLEALWRSVAGWGSAVNDRALATFAIAASKTRSLAVLDGAWRELDKRKDASGLTIGRFATAARHLGADALLERMWQHVERHNTKLDSADIGAFASAAGALGLSVLLEQVWSRKLGGASDLGAFATAAADIQNESLLRQVVDAARLRSPNSGDESLLVASIAAACGRLRLVDLLGDAWTIAGGVAHPGAEVFGSVATAAAQVRSSILPEVWRTFLASLPRLEAVAPAVEPDSEPIGPSERGENKLAIAWCSFAQAAAKIESPDFLRAVHQKWKERPDAHVGIAFASFAAAAADLDDDALATDVCSDAVRNVTILSGDVWNGLFYAAGSMGRADLVENLWKSLSLVASPPPTLEFGVLAMGAAYTRRPDLLRSMFEQWPGRRRDFESGAERTWAGFFTAAIRLVDRELIWQIFESHLSTIDPSIVATVGPIPQALAAAAAILGGERSSQLRRHLVGLRVDIDRSFAVFEQPDRTNPERLDAAARALMRWLIASYFFTTREEYARRRDLVLTAVQRPEIDSARALSVLLSSGHAVFPRATRAVWLDDVSHAVADLNALESSRLVDALSEGRLMDPVMSALRDGDGTAGAVAEPSTTPPDGGQLGQLVDDYVSSLETRYGHGHSLGRAGSRQEGLRLQTRTAERLAAMPVGSINDDGWRNILDTAIGRAAAETDRLIDRSLWRGALHNMKNQVRHRSELVRRADTAERAQQIAQDARSYLSAALARLAIPAAGEIAALNIVHDLRFMLLGNRHLRSTTTFSLPTTLRVASWPGAEAQIIIPMLREVRTNAEHALATLPENRQFYDVTVTLGDGDDQGYALLTVTNAIGHPSESPRSTKRGIETIQTLAAMLSGESLQGFAVWTSDALLKDERAFAWTIYFPLSAG